MRTALPKSRSKSFVRPYAPIIQIVHRLFSEKREPTCRGNWIRIMRVTSFAIRARRELKQIWKLWRGYRFRDLPVVRVTATGENGPARINLVMPVIAHEKLFGGLDTAIRFFKSLETFFPRARVIVLHESEAKFDCSQWPGWALASRDQTAARTIAFLDRPDFAPLIDDSDFFIATYWITAYYVTKLLAIQAGKSERKNPPFVYLIQDFEPAFYAFSSSYLLADSTYSSDHNILAVINTAMLKEYFDEKGYRFKQTFIFEPSLNPRIRYYLDRVSQRRKKRLLLVYGRPSSHRNAFELVVESLDAWAKRYDEANQWALVSLGERHYDINISKGLKLRSCGKLPLDEYANYLLDASVGLSLMVSPHPSYPPLEMAEFGVRVVTNGFANKDLSKRSANIFSVNNSNPDAIADALIACCRLHERSGGIAHATKAFLGDGDEFPFVKDIAKVLLAEVN